MVKLCTKIVCGGAISVLVIAVIIVAFVSSQNSPVDASTLELVAIVHRHGFRTPTETYASDPYQEDSWPVTWGQLLKKGKQQLYKLGQTFRNRYKSYISKYSSKTVKVRTSDLDRCHMSVASLLAAWFPPEDEYELWNTELAWQPIPIHSVPYSEDNMLAQNKTCRNYLQEQNRINAEYIANMTEEDKKFYEYLTAHMGENVDSLRQVDTYFSTLLIEKLHGYKLPEWTEKVYPDEMRKRAKLNVLMHQWNTLMKRLSAGPLIKELVEQFINKSKGENKDLKLLLYSAHDSTLSSLWRGLNFPDTIMPDFGASITFELHKLNDQYFLKMFMLNNTELTEPNELQIPNCSLPCPLYKLYEITEDVRPVDWEKECGN